MRIIVFFFVVVELTAASQLGGIISRHSQQQQRQQQRSLWKCVQLRGGAADGAAAAKDKMSSWFSSQRSSFAVTRDFGGVMG